MAYYLNLFSPETYETFSHSARTISGFRIRQKNVAQRIVPGDRFICYMTKLSRWVGILEVESEAFEDDSPIFFEENDPFIVRFKVQPLVWLEKNKAIPIHDDQVWNTLSFTQGHNKKSSMWTGKLRSSLNQLDDADATFLEKLILEQANNGREYPIDERGYKKFTTHRVRRLDKVITVSVPDDIGEEEVTEVESVDEVRESLQIQALIADIGVKMGMRIWIPNSDCSRVVELMKESKTPILSMLPLNYDDTTLKTIENIDVIWLRGRAIVRAFEVEHTTSIYSGILRMADLLALQPNMDIKLHIVAPYNRKDKVFTEIRRPVFSLLDRGPLVESCTYLSYDSLREIAQQRHLAHLSDTVLDEYAEEAE
jgi:predicted RNA-binding protein